MAFVLGIDVSTTATKAIVVDAEGVVRSVGTSEYGFETPHPLWTEQRPDQWWDAAVEAIERALTTGGLDGADVEAVGLTGQMHGAVLLDRDGWPLRPAILWNDQRTGAECDAIRAAVGPERLIAITGNDALTGFTAPKLLWVRDHEPDVWARVAHVVLPKDFVRLQLTGGYAVDKADGAGTILFDLAARDWSAEILERLELDPAWFPPTYEGPAVTGRVDGLAAGMTGLRTGTPVVAGGGDQAANAVGVGAVAAGTVALSLGTSGVVFATTDGPLFEPRGRVHAFCHAVPGRWHMMSVMLSAAGSLRWFRDAAAPGVAFADLVAPSAGVPAGSDGLVFLPYLSGERSPHADPLARGAFVGLTLTPDPGGRPWRRDRDGEHLGGSRLRGGSPGRGGRRLVPNGGGRRRRARHGRARGRAWTGRARVCGRPGAVPGALSCAGPDVPAAVTRPERARISCGARAPRAPSG